MAKLLSATQYINGKPASFWDALALEIGAPIRPNGTVDPQGLGYAAFLPPNIFDSTPIADILNFVPDGTTPYPVGTGGVKPIISIDDGVISALEWVTAINSSEVAAFTVGQAAYLDVITQYICRAGSFTYTGRLKTQIDAIFTVTGSGTTRSNLSLRAKKNGSRAEQLLVPLDRQWLGYEVTTEDVVYLIYRES
jgi:hypothetical protein